MVARIHFTYVDSLESVHMISCEMRSYNSVMELIADRGVEDWGDCKGRAWCGTCHVQIDVDDVIDCDERYRLDQLSNISNQSRLACQIPLEESVNNKMIIYLGDD